MKIINENPPNFELISRVFPLVLERKGIMFAYNDAIYNPSNVLITPWLEAHECVHLEEQARIKSPDSWWTQYLSDVDFRFNQELMAHREEYAIYKDARKDRNERAFYLHCIAQRLAGPLYGHVTDTATAKSLIANVGGGKPANDGGSPSYA